MHSDYGEDARVLLNGVTCTVSVAATVIQYLYSTLKSCKGHRGAGGFRSRLSEQVSFEVFLPVLFPAETLRDQVKIKRLKLHCRT